MARACQLLAISMSKGSYVHCSIHISYAYAMPLLSSQLLPQLRPALRTELGGAVGLGAAVGAELMNTRLSGSER